MRWNVASNLTHKIFYIVFAILIIGAIGIGVYALTTGTVQPVNPGHNSTQVFIPVGSGQYITLQSAIDYGYFKGTSPSNIPKTSLPANSPYELANQILMTVSGYNVTLQDFITYNLFATPSNSINYKRGSTIPAGGEYAKYINISTTSGFMTLQYALDTNFNLLSSVLPPPTYSWSTGTWAGCPTTYCGGTNTRTVTCLNSSSGSAVADSYCPQPKPATSYTCSCQWIDRGVSRCENPCIAFCDTCVPYSSCSTIGKEWSCFPGGKTTYCGTSGLGNVFDVLKCENY